MKSQRDLWTLLQNVSRLEREVLLALMAQWLMSRQDPAETEISTEQILSPQSIVQLGRSSNTPGALIWFEEEEAVMHIEGILSRLAALPLPPVRDTAAKPSLAQRQEMLLQLRQQEIWQHTDGSGRGMSWKYRFGPTLEAFLLANPRVTTWLLRALRYDAGTEFFEYQLSRFVVVQNTDRVMRVATLFSHLLLPMREDRLDQTRQQFESALARLVRDLVGFRWAYHEGKDSVASLAGLERWWPSEIILRIAGEPCATSTSPSPASLTG